MQRRIDILVRPRRWVGWTFGLGALLLGAIGHWNTAHAAGLERKRVLILHSFGRDFRPWGEYARNIRAELARQSQWPLDIDDQPLVSARSVDENPEAPFVEYLTALGSRRPPDLIICIGAPAAGFVQRHRSRLFPASPMLLTAVEQRRIAKEHLTEHDVVVPVAHNFPLVFDDILRVLPNTRNVVVINGASPNEKFWLGELRRELKPFENRLKLLWFDDAPFDEILRRAATLPPDTAIFWHLMNVDAAGVSHEGDSGLRRLYAVANAPIFSYDDGFFGQEVVGGPMYSVRDISERTAAVAVRLLGGEKPADIKTAAVEFAAPRYDWRLLQRWGISESLLPPGSQVYFRDPSAWEKYRWQILIACAIVITQTLLISGLLYQRRRLRFAELETRHRMSELAHVNRFTTAGELTATIAHELNQPLGAILTNAEALETMLKSASPDMEEVKEIVADIRRDDQRASDVIRRLRSLLRKAPFELKRIDLNEVVQESLGLLSGLAAAREVEIETIASPAPVFVDGDRIQLQQVVVNLVVNAIEATSEKSSGKRQILVQAARKGDVAEVSVLDNGPGVPAEKREAIFAPFASTKPNGMGMGLSIARTIVEAHLGKIGVENRDGSGAAFYVRLPLA